MPNGVFLNNIKHLSSKEAGEYAGYTHDYVSRLCREGKVPGKKIGKAWYVEADPFLHFIETHEEEKNGSYESLSQERRKTYQRLTEQKEIAEIASLNFFSTSLPPGLYQKTLAFIFAITFVFGTYIIKDSLHVSNAREAYNTVQEAIETIGHETLYRTGEKVAVTIETLQTLPDTLKRFSIHKTLLRANNFSLRVLEKVEITVTRVPDSLAAVSISDIPKLFSNLFSKMRATVLSWFGNVDKGIFVTALMPEESSELERARDALLGNLGNSQETSSAGTSSPPVVVTAPAFERVVETREVVIQAGITESYVTQLLEQLNNKLSSEIYRLSSENATQIVNNYHAISQTSKIDDLGNVTVRNSSFTDGTISGNTSFSGTSGSFSGALSAASLTVSGNSSLANFIVDAGTGNVGIGTTTPYAKLSVVGPVVAEYFHATSTTATSTIASRFLLTHAPTLPHTFSPWAIGTAGSAFLDATLVVNPGSAVADSNLIAAAVGNSVKFLVDAEGDVFVNNLTSIGDVTLAQTTASTFSVEGNTTLGDSITDVTTINGKLTVTGQTSVATVDGNFGVGTTSPFARLSVAGTAGGTTPLLSISTSTAGFATSTVFHISSTGLFGIGTTSPSSIFQIEGTDALRIPVGTTLQRPGSPLVGQVRYNTTTAQFEGFSSSSVWQGLGGVIDVDQDTYITAEETSDEDFLRFYTAGGQRLTITNTGLIGVGTTSPFARLSVAGVAGATTPLFAVSTTTAGNATSTALILDSSGRLGIGTASPLNTLTVAGNADFTGRVGVGTTSPWGALSIELDTLSPGFVVSNTGSSSPAFYVSGVNDDGVVGVGTTGGPGRRLDVFDAGNPQLRLSQTSSIYTDFQVAASTGDLTVSLNPNTTATNVFLTQPSGTTGVNLRVCQGSACPSITINNGGNVLAENAFYLGNGFRIDQVVGTTTEIAIYGVTTTTTPIIIFDEF